MSVIEAGHTEPVILPSGLNLNNLTEQLEGWAEGEKVNRDKAVSHYAMGVADGQAMAYQTVVNILRGIGGVK